MTQNQSNFLLASLSFIYNLPHTLYKYITKGKLTLKQGAYGKIPIFQPSLLTSFLNPDELIALYKFQNLKKKLKSNSQNKNIQYCEFMLSKVSRSFALVIKLLPEDLQLSIMVFYLVLRALDTVEDDMSLDITVKKDILKNFIDRLEKEKEVVSLKGIGEGYELELVEQFDKVLSVFWNLQSQNQVIIEKITEEMANGMLSFVERDLGNGCASEEEFFRYCHYVAGTVGHGLTQLFIVGEYIRVDGDEARVYEEDGIWEDSMKKSKLYSEAESMAQILQRTNIIRDFLEDLVEGRTFWPKEVFGSYVKDLKQLPKSQEKLECLNELVGKVLEFVPDMMQYLDRIENVKVLLFCGIPQIMAIKTLEECFMNEKVFEGVVKISKGKSAKIFVDLSSQETCEGMMKEIRKNVRESVEVIKKVCLNIEETKVSLYVLKQCESILKK
eukprot:snap_masked-scaffold_24-processed-gene-5.37-mRNA-1 protein AED:0.31 eAED:0.31 QI:0/-1/0/1/-1/1/1/0/441